MNRIRRHVLASIVGLLLISVGTGGMGAAREAIGPGRPAPDLRLPAADGTLVALSALRGKVVLVDFWASWCAPCRKSFPALHELSEEFRARGLEVVAVNLDQQRKDADTFLVGRPRAFSVVFDQSGKSAEAFDVQGMPASFLIGRDGTIRFAHMGFTDKVLEDYRREITQLLDDAQGGKRP